MNDGLLSPHWYRVAKLQPKLHGHIHSRSQLLGSPVERGDTLFKIAPLSGYRIILKVDES